MMLSQRRLRSGCEIGFVVAAVLGAAGSTEASTRVSFRDLTGQLRVAGLSWNDDPSVVVERDAAGIPTVHASNAAAGHAGLCFAMAEDRLWQMDFLRRVGQGRVAEIFGNDPAGATVGGDIVNRTLGLARTARRHLGRASLSTKLVMHACSVGINTQIRRAKAAGTLPPEFGVLGYEPDPWRAEDSLTVFAALISSLDQITAFTKIDRAVLGTLLGPEVANELIADQIDGLSLFDRHGRFNDPRIFLPDFIGRAAASNRLGQEGFRESLASFRSHLGGRLSKEAIAGLFASTEKILAHNQQTRWGGTNLILVGGQHTTTGKPVFENDFHLANFTPSLIYLARLNVAGSFRLKGKFLPSFPAALGGRNDRLVWGVTFAILDTADFYMERLNETGDQVFFKNRLVPIQSRPEIIQVAGGAPVSITVRTTPHGPIISDAIPPLQQVGTLALKTTYDQPEWSFDGFFQMPTAATISEFRRALRREGVGLNYSIADARGAQGNIAYQLAGLAPQRSRDNTFVPVPGADGTREWQFFASPAQLPFVQNPAAGFIVVANSRIVPEDYAPGGTPIYLSRYGDQPFRTKRGIQLVTEAIDAGGTLSLRQVSRFPVNPISAVSPAIARIYGGIIEEAGLPGDVDPATRTRLETMVEDLRRFDGDTSPASRAQLVFQALHQVSLKNFILELFPAAQFGPELGRTVFMNHTRDIAPNSRALAMVGALKDPKAPYFGATGPQDAAPARNASIVRSLREAETLLTAQLGPDPSTWSWGQVHALVSTHPFANAIPAFALPVEPFAGDHTVLHWGGFFGGGTPFSRGAQILALPPDQFLALGGLSTVFFVDSLAAERVTWDVGNRANDLGILSTGESGDPRSPHWADMRALYLRGRYAPF